jgi:hypothetical protein
MAMTTTVETKGDLLIISFAKQRLSASALRGILVFVCAIALIQLVLAYFFDKDFFKFEKWTANEYFFAVVVAGGFALGALIRSNAALVIDQRLGVVDLEHRYPLKTVRQRFAFAEIERFSADVIDKYDSDAVQPRIVLKSGEEIGLGPEVSAEIGLAKAAIARAQGTLSAHHSS